MRLLWWILLLFFLTRSVSLYHPSDERPPHSDSVLKISPREVTIQHSAVPQRCNSITGKLTSLLSPLFQYLVRYWYDGGHNDEIHFCFVLSTPSILEALNLAGALRVLPSRRCRVGIVLSPELALFFFLRVESRLPSTRVSASRVTENMQLPRRSILLVFHGRCLPRSFMPSFASNVPVPVRFILFFRQALWQAASAVGFVCINI